MKTGIHIKIFDFDLPKELIAHHPLRDRESAKLLHINREKVLDYQIKDLLELIDSKDLLVFNNTKVIPARIVGQKKSPNNTVGATLEVTLHYRVNPKTWLSFIKHSKKIKEGDEIIFAQNFKCRILQKRETGEVELFFDYDNIFEKLDEFGFIPLPPYIKRDNINDKSDRDDYQSIFAKHEGAVASPTASLHFTESLIEKLKAKGVKISFVTLHIGAGTFLPVKVTNILEHKMHGEFGSLSQDTINLIEATQKNGGNVISVGTTPLRTLEYVAKNNDGRLKPFEGEIDLFIYPEYNFQIVDKLITNFHLPKSTLFMLVCAFAGTQNMKNAYSHAINNNYRFFSYGDCSLLEKNK